MRRLLLPAVIVWIAAGPAWAISKDGSTTPTKPGVSGPTSSLRAVFEYNTAGTMDFLPTGGGTAWGWGEWEIAQATNDTGADLQVEELGFPCSGPATGPYGWVVWLNQTPGSPPDGPPSSADYYGAFTPVDPDPSTYPPITYTYINTIAEGIYWPPGSTITFGYDVTGMAGLISYNGVTTWAWYSELWDSDAPYGMTGVLQIKANGGIGPPPPPSSVEDHDGEGETGTTSWGQVKAMFR